MKKLLIIAILMLALVITAVACTDDPVEPGTTDDTTVETPTEAPTAEPDEPEETTAAPQDEETTASDPEETTAPEDSAPQETEPPEPADRLVMNKTEFELGEAILVTAIGEGTDWIGIAERGAPATVAWWYITSIGSGTEVDLTTATRSDSEPWAFAPGEYTLYLVPNDQSLDSGNNAIDSIDFVIKAPDPAKPVHLITPDSINEQALSTGGSTFTNHIGSSEVITEGNRTFVRLTANGGDPYVAVITIGSNMTLPQYMAISYRTNSAMKGQFFMGSGAGWNGQGDCFDVNWEEGGWNLLVIDLTATGMTSITDGLINYGRLDFFAGDSAEGDYFDVEFIGFFLSPEGAAEYDYEMHKAPMWNESGFILHHSFDELDKYAGAAKVEGVFTPGQSANWDKTITLNDFTVDTLRYWGWVAGTGGLGQFGYQINGGTPIYDDAWTVPDPGLEPHMPAGHDHFTRMAIMISLDGLEGENTIRALYKNAEGAEACLSEFTVILPEKPKDITNTFASDITSVAAGTALNATDLSNYFTAMLNLGQYLSVDGAYVMDGISEIFADVNGKYALTVDFAAGSNGAYAAIVRGVHAVNSTQGEMKINNFYETDGAGFGGAGIYACVINGNLKLTVKTFDPSITTCVKNVEYNLPCTGNKLTMADDGETVYVMVDGVLYATFAISGSVEYPAENISLVSPATTFAETVVVSLIDGTTETLTNTLVDSTCETQIALAVRGGSFNFSSVKVEGFSAVEIPEFEIPDVPPVVTESIPMESWTVTGHAAGLTSKDKEGIGGMVAAGGLDVGALLHQGSVGLGELDLSKYSKVIIKYGIDNGPTTIEKHTAKGTNRIMLTTADNNMTMTPGGDVLAYVDYTPNGWSLMSIEIDLTAVDYNGNVFLTWDTLDGTFMLIGSVEFVCVETPEA